MIRRNTFGSPEDINVPSSEVVLPSESEASSKKEMKVGMTTHVDTPSTNTLSTETIFIHNLHYKTTVNEIEAFFTKYNPLKVAFHKSKSLKFPVRHQLMAFVQVQVPDDKVLKDIINELKSEKIHGRKVRLVAAYQWKADQVFEKLSSLSKDERQNGTSGVESSSSAKVQDIQLAGSIESEPLVAGTHNSNVDEEQEHNADGIVADETSRPCESKDLVQKDCESASSCANEEVAVNQTDGCEILHTNSETNTSHAQLILGDAMSIGNQTPENVSNNLPVVTVEEVSVLHPAQETVNLQSSPSLVFEELNKKYKS